mgnify:CR=1 FL=1
MHGSDTGKRNTGYAASVCIDVMRLSVEAAADLLVRAPRAPGSEATVAEGTPEVHLEFVLVLVPLLVLRLYTVLARALRAVFGRLLAGRAAVPAKPALEVGLARLVVRLAAVHFMCCCFVVGGGGPP